MKRFGKFRNFVFMGSVLLAIALILTFAAFESTSEPQFCGSCHIMRPYYESWKTSSHNNIACVDCHIPPGITSTLRKKYEASSMLVRYFTGTYGTNPWAEVDDVSCLQCHQRRLVAGTELFEGVLFNHTPHLTEMRREKKLRCTSCHSQIVQGSHIAVTTSTCILCHFKDQEPGTGLAECRLCHLVPETVISREGLEFQHADVKRFDMKCEWCHAGVAQGEGDVPRTRCLTCHSEQNRLAKFDEAEELHRIHVTDHKVECLNCHNQIQHITQKEIQTVKGGCDTCHGSGHSPQRSLYAGIGGKGLPPGPNVMYLAGITCEGCHFVEHGENDSRINRASEISCMACHGAPYYKIYLRWKDLTEDRLRKAQMILSQAEKRFRSPYPQAIQDAQDNIRLVERAIPIHNVDYSLAVLDRSMQMINQTLKEQGQSEFPIPWISVPFASSCLSCHQGIESRTANYAGMRFPHTTHVIRNEMECDICHVKHEIPLKQKPPIMQPTECASCHHDTGFEQSCAKCHQALPQSVKVRGNILDRKGLAFDHAMHIEAIELSCPDCHLANQKFARTPPAGLCSDCHGE